MKKNFMLIVALAAVLFFAAPMTSEAADNEGTWKEGTQGWWFELSDGTYCANGFYEIDEEVYYFDAAGWMKTGWVKDVTDWYYFDQSGAMVKGWLNDGGTWYYLEENDGWMYSEGSWYVGETLYLFEKSGAWVGTAGWYELEYNSDYSEWFYLNGAGVIQTGWQLIGGEWYYLEEGSGWMYEGGWYTIDEKEWLFDENGVWRHAQGWNKSDGNWFYLDANGNRQTGWLNDGGKWYYLEPSEDSGYGYGQMYDGRKLYVAEDDAYYFFQYDGAMVAGWYNYGSASDVYGDWVYCATNGTPHDGWLKDGGNWYYIREGEMLAGQSYRDYDPNSGMEYDDASAYYLADNGAMVYGWYHNVYNSTSHSYSDWIYTDPNTGVMYTGWVLSGGKWYYIDEGWMVTGVACTMEQPEWPEHPEYPQDLQNPVEPVEADYDIDGTAGLSDIEQAAYDAAVQAYNEALQSDNAKLQAYYKACEEYAVAHEKCEADYEAYKKSAYVFGDDGAMATGGWCAIKSSHDTTWMYANADGTAYDGWLNEGGTWYYIDRGYMVTNEYRDGCWLGADGVWVK